MEVTRQSVKDYFSLLHYEIDKALDVCENYRALFERATSTTTTLTGMPGGGGAGRDALLASVSDAKSKCESSLSMIGKCKEKILEVFEKADLTDEEYKVAKAKQIDGLTWKQTGAIIGVTERQAYRIYDSALDKCASVLSRSEVHELSET